MSDSLNDHEVFTDGNHFSLLEKRKENETIYRFGIQCCHRFNDTNKRGARFKWLHHNNDVEAICVIFFARKFLKGALYFKFANIFGSFPFLKASLHK